MSWQEHTAQQRIWAPERKYSAKLLVLTRRKGRCFPYPPPHQIQCRYSKVKIRAPKLQHFLHYQHASARQSRWEPAGQCFVNMQGLLVQPGKRVSPLWDTLCTINRQSVCSFIPYLALKTLEYSEQLRDEGRCFPPHLTLETCGRNRDRYKQMLVVFGSENKKESKMCHLLSNPFLGIQRCTLLLKQQSVGALLG